MVYVFQQSVELRARSADYLVRAAIAADPNISKRLIELAARYFDIAQKLDVTPNGAAASPVPVGVAAE